MCIVDVRCYMCSKLSNQLIPMYIDGVLDDKSVSTYCTSFVIQSVCAILRITKSHIKSINHISEWDVEYTLQGQSTIILRFSIDPNSCPFSDIDVDSYWQQRNWFFHHIVINKHVEYNWIRAKVYLENLFRPDSKR